MLVPHLTPTSRTGLARGAVALTAVATLAAAGLAGTPATAAPAADRGPTVTTLADGLVGPLSVAVAPDGTRWFTENFAGALHRQVPGSTSEVVFRSPHPKAEVGAVSVGPDGRPRFTITGSKGQIGLLKTLGPQGKPHTIADLHAFEASHNPDAGTHYGFSDLPQSCADQVPPEVPASYDGIVDSHPYSTAADGAATYVADAAGNDILRVGPTGRVRVVSVLKPVEVVITQDAATANHLPDCTVGHVYGFEGVPTDVEVGPGGRLYVSSLPGGPEDGSAGANGRVLRINPATGRATVLASGLLGATGLGVARNGDVYVSQLFGGEISRIKHGTSTARPFVSVPLPADVDVVRHGLVAADNVLPAPDAAPDGRVVRISLGG